MFRDKRSGFSIIELIISIVITTALLGCVTATIKTGLNLHDKIDSNISITNGTRMTMTSFRDKVWPMLEKADYIEILDSMPTESVLSHSAQYDCYLYLDNSNQSVKYRIGPKTYTLAGSESITALDFTLPVAEKASPDNYILNMHVEAGAGKSFVSADVHTGLSNYPLKSAASKLGTTKSYYEGSVLRFSLFSFTEFEPWTVSDDNNPNAVVPKDASVTKNTSLQLRYSISLPSGFSDATKLLWYATLKSAASQTKSCGYYEPDEKYPSCNFENSSKDHYWPLLIKSNDAYYLANELYKSIDVLPNSDYLEIPTEDPKFYVYTGDGDLSKNNDFDANGKLLVSNKAVAIGRYCMLRAWAVPAYYDNDNIIYPKGYAQWSRLITIEDAGYKPGAQFFKDWITDIEAYNNGENLDYTANSEHWYKTGASAIQTIDSVTGEQQAVITVKGTSNNIQLAKVLRPNYVGEARHYEKVALGNSYSSITNYSFILDLDTNETTAGIGILLNGYKGTTNPSGFIFYYDPAANGYPLRLHTLNGLMDSYKAKGVYEVESPLASAINNSVKGTDITQTTNNTFYNKYYNPQYVPSALQNNIFNDAVESPETTLRSSEGNNTAECAQMKGRHRFMITLLDYYPKSEGGKATRLILRFRLLKTLKEVRTEHPEYSEKYLRKTDPFLIGPLFYKSEPAWYGFYVGQTPTFIAGENNWKFKAMRSGSDEGLDVVRSKDSTNGTYYSNEAVYYALQSPASSLRYSNGFNRTNSINGNPVTKYFNGGIYRRISLYPAGAMSGNNSVEKIGITTPERLRWFGLAIWSDKNSKATTSSVKVYDLILGPGFSADELRMLMPVNCKMYGMNETNGGADTSEAFFNINTDTDEKWNAELFNDSTNGSNGDGNIAANENNPYLNRFTGAGGNVQRCIESLYHSGKDDCTCPICIMHRNYQNHYINLW